ncbi:hypothetical protein AAVH_25971 [Aphelenchoides avenae]|nr:hypothetical protein AAVH_25971 [Aphelenchus avenae]
MSIFCRENTPIFNHLRAKADSLQCQIRSLRVDGAAGGIDYALADFLGVYLKPRTYTTKVADEEDCTMLFTHRALRGNMTHLMYQFKDHPPPDCIIQNFVGVDVVESCAMSTRVDPRPWMGKFVEMFENAERGPNIIREVTLLHAHFEQPMPLPHVFGPLGQPWRTNITTEPSHFVKEWSRVTGRAYGATTVESPVADFFIFRNAKAAQKLGIFAWTIEQRKNDAQTSFHYAYLLRIIDI